MTSPNPPADDALMDELRTAAAHLDPPPATALEAGRAALTWRTIDAELAELTYDSLVADPAAAGVRGPSGPRALTFEAGDLVVDCEVHPAAGDRLRVLGQIAGDVPEGAVSVHHRAGSADVPLDDLGRFDVADVPAGPVRLRVRTAQRTVHTEWLVF
jgi:hypothetical protein